MCEVSKRKWTKWSFLGRDQSYCTWEPYSIESPFKQHHSRLTAVLAVWDAVFGGKSAHGLARPFGLVVWYWKLVTCASRHWRGMEMLWYSTWSQRKGVGCVATIYLLYHRSDTLHTSALLYHGTLHPDIFEFPQPRYDSKPGFMPSIDKKLHAKECQCCESCLTSLRKLIGCRY